MSLSIDILEVVGRDVWPLFAPHHYLTAKYAGHGAFMAVMPDGEPVAFTSFIAFPHGKIKNAKRGHRTVVLPDFQGLGMGARLSDWMAEELLSRGHRFYSRTSHPRLGAYRDASPRWRSTTKGPTTIKQADIDKMTAAGKSKISANVQSIGRLCWSHEYMGAPQDAVSATLPPPDTIAVQIATADTYDALIAVYRAAGPRWTPAHTNLAAARRTAIEGAA